MVTALTLAALGPSARPADLPDLPEAVAGNNTFADVGDWSPTAETLV